MAAFSTRRSRSQWDFLVCRQGTVGRGQIRFRGSALFLLGVIWGLFFAVDACAQMFPPIPNQPPERGRPIGQFPPQMGGQGMAPGHGMAPGRGQPRGNMQQLPKIEASGTIDVVTPMGLQIATPSGQKWQLVLEQECKIELTGKALPDVLRPGVIISFTASIEKKTGHATEKVESLVICSIDQDHQLGVFPEQGFGGEALGEGPGFGEMGGVGAGQGPNGFGAPGGMGPLGGPSERPSRTGRGRQNPQDEIPVESYQVCGRISSITKLGKITVSAPNPHFRAPIQIDVGENPEISLELSGREALTFIRRGAKLTGKGVQIGPTAARMSELSIELTEPLTFAPPKKERELAANSEKPQPRSSVRKPATRSPEDKQADGQSKEQPAQEASPEAKPEPSGKTDKKDPPKAAGIELPPLP